MEVRATETGVLLPPGVEPGHLGGTFGPEGMPEHGIIDNRTDLPDGVVQEAVATYFEENSSLAWGGSSTFQTYANNNGSLLARRAFVTPTNVVDEIRLARELAERDDDIAPAIGQLLALAFGEGFQHQYADEKTREIFTEIGKNMDLNMVFAEMYRELLISSQINTATLFTRENLEYELEDASRTLKASVAAPLVGVLPAENIRVVGNDMFHTAQLAYEPDNDALRRWLDEYFSDNITAARKAQMGREDRISANMFTGVIQVNALDYECPPVVGGRLYLLNPRMVARSTLPKGMWKYPRPMLTRDFALLEAKRLLNIMDYALLQGGSNFIVVAKKGSDQRPAMAGEVENLQRVVRQASRSGVIVGDHRLTFEIITPKLDELLNPAKRKLIGRKLAMAMLRLSEHDQEQGGGEGIKQDTEVLARVVAYDRKLIARHIENKVYRETTNRNANVFTKGPACLWFPKIILQGTQFFTDYILKLRDRGDIPRAWGLQIAGFDWDAAVAQRKQEVSSGDDAAMMPGMVPHSSPQAGPQDNGPGRPTGAGDGQTTLDPNSGRPRRTIQRSAGETIKAWYEEEAEEVARMGEITMAVLEQHPDRTIGRITGTERKALDDLTGPGVLGSTTYIPVNPDYAVVNEKAVRLRDGLSLLVGERREDAAVVAKMIAFREPEFDEVAAENFVIRWGFPVTKPEVEEQ